MHVCYYLETCLIIFYVSHVIINNCVVPKGNVIYSEYCRSFKTVW